MTEELAQAGAFVDGGLFVGEMGDADTVAIVFLDDKGFFETLRPERFRFASGGRLVLTLSDVVSDQAASCADFRPLGSVRRKELKAQSAPITIIATMTLSIP